MEYIGKIHLGYFRRVFRFKNEQLLGTKSFDEILHMYNTHPNNV